MPKKPAPPKSLYALASPKTEAEWKDYEIRYKAFITETRSVKLMGEHSDSPLWDVEGVEMELDVIARSKDLKTRLIAWNDWHCSLDIENQDAQSPLPAVHWKDCADAGLMLARDIKHQLPDWKVIYFDRFAYAAGSKSYNVDIA